MRAARWKSAAVNLTLLAGSTLVALFLLEGALRTWFAYRAWSQPLRTSDTDWLAPDEQLGWRLHPDSNRFSRRGSQSTLVGLEPDGLRVLILGDSVCFGGGFVDTLPGRTETLLRGDNNLVPVEVLNSSAPGYTNYQEIEWLKKYGLEYKPKLVGVVFVMNDLFRFLHLVRTREGEPFSAGEFVPSDEAGRGIDSWIHQLKRHSVLMEILRYEVGVVDNAVDRWESRGYSFEYREDFYTAWQEEPWHMIESQMRELVEAGEQSGFRVFLVAVPFGDQLRPEYLARDSDFVKMPQRKLTEICDRLGIECLDLFDDLKPGRDLQRDRIHLTEEGKSTASKKIAEFLTRKRLVPARPEGID